MVVSFVGALIVINPYYTFTGDSLLKYVQARSLSENHFRSEDLSYPGKTTDPEYKFFPFRTPYLL